VNQEPKSAANIAKLMMSVDRMPIEDEGYLPSHEATVMMGRIKTHRLKELDWDFMLKEFLIPAISVALI
jgi:hypothetical protein